jgi:nucleotidyltransferase substrate binding protein (TIGR01987 family)
MIERWKQRFENYEKAMRHLRGAAEKEELSEIEQAGLIQFFEVAFELAWKVMKDYLEAQGFVVKSPREAIKQAFQNELIARGDLWLEALEKRNLAAHTYDDTILDEFQELISQTYFPEMDALYQTLKKER